MFPDGELLQEDVFSFIFNPSPEDKSVYRRVAGNNKIWKRFSLLPNVEGQKYTLGNHFTSREDQGELIFWNGASSRNSICEITVLKNKFWVKPFEDNWIRINEVEIRKRTQLRFGDHLVLGEMEEGSKFGSDIKYPLVFLFMERELNPKYTLKRDNAELLEDVDLPLIPVPRRQSMMQKEDAMAVARNPVVLSQIFSHLHHTSLKSMRLVSQLWNKEASKLLKKKSQVKFQYDSEMIQRPGSHEYHYEWHPENESLRFFRYFLEMKSFSLENWSIVLPTLDNEKGVKYHSGTPGAKLLADIDLLLANNGTLCCIKKLNLGGTVRSVFDIQLRMKILSGLQLTLEDIEISKNFGRVNDREHPSQRRPPLTFISDTVFEKIERLTFSMESHDDRYIENFIQTMIPAVRNVRVLVLHGSSSLRLDSLTFLDALDSFPNLEEITLEAECGIAPAKLKLIKDMKKSLKKLVLNGVAELKKLEHVADFENMLARHSITLQTLQFILPEFQNPTQIQIPFLPQVKNLGIGWDIRNGREVCVTSFAFPGPHDHIVYEEHAPSLQSLKLWKSHSTSDLNIHRFWNKYTPIFDSFFPKTLQDGEVPQVVKTLHYLDIPFQDHESRIFPRAEEVATMFPNVFCKWAKEARSKVAGSFRPMTLRPRPSI